MKGRDLEALEKVAIGEPGAIDTLFWVSSYSSLKLRRVP